MPLPREHILLLIGALLAQQSLLFSALATSNMHMMMYLMTMTQLQPQLDHDSLLYIAAEGEEEEKGEMEQRHRARTRRKRKTWGAAGDGGEEALQAPVRRPRWRRKRRAPTRSMGQPSQVRVEVVKSEGEGPTLSPAAVLSSTSVPPASSLPRLSYVDGDESAAAAEVVVKSESEDHPMLTKRRRT